MRSIRKPNGSKHALFDKSDLEFYINNPDVIKEQIQRNADEKITRKGVHYLVTFSTARMEEWMTVPDILREIERRCKSLNGVKNSPEKIFKEKRSSKSHLAAPTSVSVELNRGVCSADFKKHLSGSSTDMNQLKRQFAGDQSAFRLLWRHVRHYNDALYALQFITPRKQVALLAMRAVDLATTPEQIQEARDKLPREYENFSTEQIQAFLHKKRKSK